MSQIWGLQVQVSIPNPSAPDQVLASVTGTMPATAFCDLWDRTTNLPNTVNNGTMSASFQALLTNVVWTNAAASPLLQALQTASLPGQLSIRFTVDSFQSDANQATFTYGRIVGTIGPALAGEAPRSTPRRLAPAQFWSHPPLIPQNLGTSPSIFGTYGAAGAVWDAARSVLILDLGNTVPTRGSAGTVPSDGWPIKDATFQLTIPGPSVSPIGTNLRIKSGAKLGDGAPSVVGTVSVSASTYATFAGVVEVPVSPNLVPFIDCQPLKVMDVTLVDAPALALQEDFVGAVRRCRPPVPATQPG